MLLQLKADNLNKDLSIISKENLTSIKDSSELIEKGDILQGDYLFKRNFFVNLISKVKKNKQKMTFSDERIKNSNFKSRAESKNDESKIVDIISFREKNMKTINETMCGMGLDKKTQFNDSKFNSITKDDKKDLKNELKSYFKKINEIIFEENKEKIDNLSSKIKDAIKERAKSNYKVKQNDLSNDDHDENEGDYDDEYDRSENEQKIKWNKMSERQKIMIEATLKINSYEENVNDSEIGEVNAKLKFLTEALQDEKNKDFLGHFLTDEHILKEIEKEFIDLMKDVGFFKEKNSRQEVSKDFSILDDRMNRINKLNNDLIGWEEYERKTGELSDYMQQAYNNLEIKLKFYVKNYLINFANILMDYLKNPALSLELKSDEKDDKKLRNVKVLLRNLFLDLIKSINTFLYKEEDSDKQEEGNDLPEAKKEKNPIGDLRVIYDFKKSLSILCLKMSVEIIDVLGLDFNGGKNDVKKYNDVLKSMDLVGDFHKKYKLKEIYDFEEEIKKLQKEIEDLEAIKEEENKEKRLQEVSQKKETLNKKIEEIKKMEKEISLFKVENLKNRIFKLAENKIINANSSKKIIEENRKYEDIIKNVREKGVYKKEGESEDLYINETEKKTEDHDFFYKEEDLFKSIMINNDDKKKLYENLIKNNVFARIRVNINKRSTLNRLFNLFKIERAILVFLAELAVLEKNNNPNIPENEMDDKKEPYDKLRNKILEYNNKEYDKRIEALYKKTEGLDKRDKIYFKKSIERNIDEFYKKNKELYKPIKIKNSLFYEKYKEMKNIYSETKDSNKNNIQHLKLSSKIFKYFNEKSKLFKKINNKNNGFLEIYKEIDKAK